MISITIHNREAHDLYVTVMDLNSRETPIALNQGRVNGGYERQIDIEEDGRGIGNIHWHVVNALNATETGDGNANPSIGDQVDVELG